MEEKQLTLLREQVQYNCHVADARHGGDYGLCTYLLRMREYYRWECGLGFAEVPPRERVAEWIERREALWDGLDAAEFAPLTLAGKRFGPFDSAAINHHLVPGGLVYSGGLGSAGKPHFFLGRLERQEVVGGHTLFVSGRELARDLAAPPAMTLEGDIFVRRESLRRMLWEKLESWRWQRPDNALGRAFSSYAFDSDTEAALDAMAENEIDLLILHEQGECAAGGYLGDRQWQAMLSDFAFTPAELVARGARSSGRLPLDPAGAATPRSHLSALLHRQSRRHAQGAVSRPAGRLPPVA